MPLTTAEKVNVGFIMGLVIVAVIGVASLTSIRRFADTSDELRRSNTVLLRLQNLLVTLTQAESAERAYVITGEELYLRPYAASVSRVTAQIRTLREETFADATQQERLGILGDVAARRLAIMAEIIGDRRTGNVERAVAQVRSGRGKAVMDSVLSIAQAFEQAESERLRARTRTATISGRVATGIIAFGGVVAFVVVYASMLIIRQDYTERRRAEFALRNSQTLLSQFMENLPIGVVVTDTESRIRFANNAAVDMVGSHMLLETDEPPLPLYRIGEMLPYPEVDTPLKRALDGLINSIDDAEVRTDGRQFPIEVSAAPVYDARGRIAYAIATFSDVTERRRAEEALRTAKDAAETANRTKSDFLARMSHELRTPLNSVIGFANILMKNKRGALQPQELAYLERIQENGTHLLLLINDILDLSKIEAGKVEIDTVPTDVGEVLRGVLSQLETQVKHENVQLRAAVPAELELIDTDPVRLRQVLINLIGNALKFTERGYVEVKVEAHGGRPRPTRIVVQDTGIGIPPDRLDAIFDAFEQAESSTTRKYGGTGLGLPISRALCELLGYELRVSSEVGAGTVFTIELEPARVA